MPAALLRLFCRHFARSDFARGHSPNASIPAAAASVCAMTISSLVQLLTGRLRRRGGAHALDRPASIAGRSALTKVRRKRRSLWRRWQRNGLRRDRRRRGARPSFLPRRENQNPELSQDAAQPLARMGGRRVHRPDIVRAAAGYDSLLSPSTTSSRSVPRHQPPEACRFRRGTAATANGRRGVESGPSRLRA